MKFDSLTPHLDKLPEILRKNLDKNLCVCNEVIKIDIINAIVNGATTVEEIKKRPMLLMERGVVLDR
jgi:NAD(P)H-nitrite reductase large subunit